MNPVALLANLFEHRRQIPPVFCIETAMNMMELSWQAYYDVPGKVTSGGYGEIDVNQHGYDVIEALSDEAFDTFVVVLRHRGDGRLVVAFRGSSSKKQWLNNLRFKQIELDLEELPALEYENVVQRVEGSGMSSDGSPLPQASVEDPGPSDGGEAGGPGPSSDPDPATMLTEVVAAGAEIIQQTGDLVVEGVKNTAHMLRIDRIPGVKRLFAGYVHKGFYEAYVGIRPRLHQVIHKALCDQPAHMYFTGHSLGGALASLAAIDLTINTLPVVESQLAERASTLPANTRRGRRKENKCQVSMYSFGSPRVFNLALAQRYNKLIPDSFRVICDGDVVAGLPPWLPVRVYKHVGTEVVVDGYGSGSLVIDPSFIERRLRINTKRRLAEHSMAYYRRALEGCMFVNRLNLLERDS